MGGPSKIGSNSLETSSGSRYPEFDATRIFDSVCEVWAEIVKDFYYGSYVSTRFSYKQNIANLQTVDS